jgi:iron(III) transport system ATP-binding protein
MESSVWRRPITFAHPPDRPLDHPPLDRGPAGTATVPGTADVRSLADSGARVALRQIWHRFAGAKTWTLQGLDLALGPGELVGLLGPSGCGKTTLLRLIAGFENPHHGEIELDGRTVARPGRVLPPERRGVGMVFQDYALFPHLDAWANTCFGLRRDGLQPGGSQPGGPRSKGALAAEQRDRAVWLLELLGLGGLEQRYPHELSGGQRQRLALARALAPGPAVVLLDEPFSNLDVEVRLRLRSELPEVLARCGTSALLVTHDPEEALAICDRVAVLHQGVLQQCATPLELVQRPATAFVARFVLGALPLPARWQGDRLETALGWLQPAPGGAAEPALEPSAGTPEGLPAAPGMPPPAGQRRSDRYGAEEPAAPSAPEERLQRSDPAHPAHPADPEVQRGDSELQVLLRPTDLSFAPRDEPPSPLADADDEVEVMGREFLGRDWLYLVQHRLGRLRVRQPLSVQLARGERRRLRLASDGEPLLYPAALPLRPCDPGATLPDWWG